MHRVAPRLRPLGDGWSAAGPPVDDFDGWHVRYEIAKSENRNSHLSGDSERMQIAHDYYDRLIAEYHELYQAHIEKVRVRKWMLQDETPR